MPETVFEAAFRVAKNNGVKEQLPGQEDQVFLFSILKALGTCPQEDWDALGNSCPKAHDWYQTAADANNKSRPIPFPDGFKQAKPVIPPPPPKPVVEIKQPTSHRLQTAVPNVANTPKAQTEPRKEKEKRSKNAGILDEIRKVVIQNPNWNARQVYEYIIANGFPTASQALVSVNVGDIKRVILVAKNLGYWKEANAEKKTA